MVGNQVGREGASSEGTGVMGLGRASWGLIAKNCLERYKVGGCLCEKLHLPGRGVGGASPPTNTGSLLGRLGTGPHLQGHLGGWEEGG